jgi:ParB-like chromosome segregation protein Spo0J
METIGDIALAIRRLVRDADDPFAVVNALQAVLAGANPNYSEPVSHVRWIPVDMVEPNDYNPNSVARPEMSLLYTSIKHDGYTQPIVAIFDPERKKFVVVDGFHRYHVMRTKADIQRRCNGRLPVVVLEKSMAERMASTVRHNRARGEHSVQGMSALVYGMLKNGVDDASICRELGMSPEELLRLKHITGFAKLFADSQYSKAWEANSQIRARQAYLAEGADDDGKT